MKKIVGWDLDGTLIDTSNLLKSTYKQLFGSTSKIDILASPYQNMLNNEVKPNRDWWRKFWSTYRSNISYAFPYKGIKEVLKNLKDKDINNVVISSLSDNIIPNLLTSTNIHNFFEIKIGGTNTKFKKPDPYSIKYCIDKLNSAESHFTFIGDSQNDKKLAENANVEFIHAGWNRYCNIGSKYPVTQPKDIIDLI